MESHKTNYKEWIEPIVTKIDLPPVETRQYFYRQWRQTYWFYVWKASQHAEQYLIKEGKLC